MSGSASQRELACRRTRAAPAASPARRRSRCRRRRGRRPCWPARPSDGAPPATVPRAGRRARGPARPGRARRERPRPGAVTAGPGRRPAASHCSLELVQRAVVAQRVDGRLTQSVSGLPLSSSEPELLGRRRRRRELADDPRRRRSRRRSCRTPSAGRRRARRPGRRRGPLGVVVVVVDGGFLRRLDDVVDRLEAGGADLGAEPRPLRSASARGAGGLGALRRSTTACLTS